MSRETRKTQRGVIRGITACAVGIILVTAAVFIYQGVINREGPEPGATEGLSAQVCYHDITLSWEPAEKADGYFIYAAEEPGDTGTTQQAGEEGDAPAFALVGEITDGEVCEYEIDAYTHDKPYQFKVAAYGYNSLTKNKNEGEPSEAVSVIYDSSKYAQKIPVLTYHGLIPAGYPVHSSLTVPADMFEQQMDYLKEEGFQTLSLDEFYQWYKGKLELPVKSCVVTFDDGADNVYYLGYPILKENGQKATVFCIGHHLEENGGVTMPYTPEDGVQRRFAKDKMEEVRAEYPDLAFESHTYNMHARINGYKPVNVLTYDEMMEDFALNEPYGFTYMAYPWGATNKTMKKAARKSGYKLAFGYEPFRYARRTDNPYRVRRVKVNGFNDLDSFIQIVNGDYAEQETVE